MKKIYYIGLLFVIYGVWQACSDSETLTPMRNDEIWGEVVIKKGNEPYDHYIKTFYDSTGVAILYDWNTSDAFWNGDERWYGVSEQDTITETLTYFIDGDDIQAFDDDSDGKADRVFIINYYYQTGHTILPHWKTTRYEGAHSMAWEYFISVSGLNTGDSITFSRRMMNTDRFRSQSYHVTPTDSGNIARQLELYNEVLFKYYSADFLKKYLGRKILLGQNLFQYKYTPDEEISDSEYYLIPFFYNHTSLILGWGEKDFDQLNEDEKKYLRYWINRWLIKKRFWEPLVDQGNSSVFDEFFAVSEESYDTKFNTTADKLEAGFLPNTNLEDKKSDIFYYFEAFTLSTFAQFMGEEEGGDYNGCGKYPKCLQKYNLLREAFINVGIDIDRIKEDGTSYGYTTTPNSSFYHYYYPTEFEDIHTVW